LNLFSPAPGWFWELLLLPFTSTPLSICIFLDNTPSLLQLDSASLWTDCWLDFFFLGGSTSSSEEELLLSWVWAGLFVLSTPQTQRLFPFTGCSGPLQLLSAPAADVDGAEEDFESSLALDEVVGGTFGFVVAPLAVFCLLLSWLRLRRSFFLFLAISWAIRLLVSSTSASSSPSPKNTIIFIHKVVHFKDWEIIFKNFWDQKIFEDLFQK
jgi:hypothetical protein